MAIEQREVYLLPFPLPGGGENHLFIVLSAKEANDYEGTFIGVMITTSDTHYNDLSFDLNDNMFESPLRKPNSHVRMHLLTLYYSTETIGGRMNRMKVQYFKQLMASIGEVVFNYNFTPIQPQ